MSRKRKADKLSEVDGKPRAWIGASGDDSKHADKDIVLNDALAASLKDHQVQGIRFLWEHVSTNQGCMLAHSMGLGKSAQAIILASLMMRHKGVKTVLVVTPKSTLPGWSSEFPLWSKKVAPKAPPLTPVVIGDDSWHSRCAKLKKWGEEGGVLMLSYELYGSMVGAFKKRAGAASSLQTLSHSDIVHLLQNPGPEVIICDEGHTIRNQTSSIAGCLNGVGTRRRVMMTGTPMQNCLEELWGMIEFVRPGHFPRREFVSYFQIPIQQGQTSTCSRMAAIRMKQRSYTLQQEMNAFVHRRDQSILLRELPQKDEYVVVCPQSEFQLGMHKRFRSWYIKRSAMVRGGHNTLLYTHVLNKISAHPDLLKETLEEVLRGDRPTAENGWSSELSWAEGVLINAPNYRPMLLSRSPKLTAMLYILEYCIKHKEKLLVFSQWTMTLQLVLRFAERMSPELDRWCLTGDMPQAKRKLAIESFQKSKGPALFLISTTAGGMGINLNTAHRAVLFDVAFNPAVDQQAVFRCYRYGLTHRVRIYRLITTKMPESAVYQRCVSKEWLGKKVIDAQAPSRAHIKGPMLKNSSLFADPDLPDADEIDHDTLWNGEKRLAMKEDALLQYVEAKMQARNVKLGRVFRHQSLLLDEVDAGEVTPDMLRTHESYVDGGGRTALNSLVDAEGVMPAALPEETEEDFLNFIDTAAPLPEDIREMLEDSEEEAEDDKFVPDLSA